VPQEEERKYDVEASFRLPDLGSVAADVIRRPAKTLTATYFDTEDLRLARSGASLRYRAGDDLPWTVKLATDVPGVRQEVSRPGPASPNPPQDLVWLVASLTRGAPLKKVAVLKSRRVAHELFNAKGKLLAEVVDDRVSADRLTFREVEVERKTGSPRLLSTVERHLIEAGARPAAFASKLARALGDAALKPPDVVPPGAEPDDDVVTRAVRAGVKRLLDHDPLLRLDEPLPDGDTAVHQMRVACRRLRSDLRTFGSLVREGWAKPLRGELGWLAGLLGAARDAEVLRERLRRTAQADPLTTMDTVAIDRIDAVLARRQADALRTLGESMRSGRYLALIDTLVTATQGLPLKKGTLHGLTNEPTKRLSEAMEKLTSEGPDAQWHRVRILAKRARYATEAEAGHRDPRARALARLQDLLGEHQDAAVAAETWLSFGLEPALAVTAGRLFERERTAIREARAEFFKIAPELQKAPDRPE
jgi:CHAD domain-containing protein